MGGTMTNSRIQSVTVLFVIMPLLCISLFAGSKYVQGFPGIPVYPGTDMLVDKERSRDADGNPWVWYEFKSQKLKNEWDNNAVKIMKEIINFYKIKLAKAGWQYIGEGVQRHHWIKGKEGLAIGFADYAITYTHMSNWDARTNVIKLSERDFIRIYVDCAKALQKIYERQGIKTGNDYVRKMMDMSRKNPLEFTKEDKTKSEIKKTIKDRLKTFRISPARFKELKSVYGEAVQKYINNYTNEYIKNQMGFMAIDQMDTSDNLPYGIGMPQINKMLP